MQKMMEAIGYFVTVICLSVAIVAISICTLLGFAEVSGLDRVVGDYVTERFETEMKAVGYDLIMEDLNEIMILLEDESF